MGMFKALTNRNKQANGVTQANWVMGGLAPEGEKAQRLNATGQDGTATITAVRDTGTTVNDNPTIEMDLQVKVAGGGPPYPVTHEQAVSRLAVAYFQPGASVLVKVDPADPETILVA